MSLSVLNNFELCYRGTSFKVQGGGSVIAAFFLAHNYVSEQFGNYVEYGTINNGDLLNLYYSLFLPIRRPRYCCALWGLAYTSTIHCIGMLPKRMIRIMNGVDRQCQTNI